MLEGQTARLSGPALETLAIIAYKQPIVAGADLGDPRRERRRDAEDARRARLRRGERARAHARQPVAVLAPRARSSSGSASTRSPTSRRSPTSFPSRRSSRRSSAGLLRSSTSETRRQRRTTPPRVAAVPADGEPTDAGGRTRASGCRRCSRAPGLGSRRTCEVLIADGPGHRDGEVAVLGRARRSASTIAIALDGVPVVVDTTRRALAAEQARGLRDDRAAIRRAGRPCSSSCPAEPRVFPVGRLDLDTEGLLLLTNDGELAELLTHPRHGVEKEYLAEVEGVPSPARAARAARGRRARRRPDPAGAGAGRAGVGDGDERARDRGEGGPQAHGAAHVRGGRPSGACGSSAPASGRCATRSSRRGVAGADAGEVRALYAAALDERATTPPD